MWLTAHWLTGDFTYVGFVLDCSPCDGRPAAEGLLNVFSRWWWWWWWWCVGITATRWHFTVCREISTKWCSALKTSRLGQSVFTLISSQCKTAAVDPGMGWSATPPPIDQKLGLVMAARRVCLRHGGDLSLTGRSFLTFSPSFVWKWTNAFQLHRLPDLSHEGLSLDPAGVQGDSRHDHDSRHGPALADPGSAPVRQRQYLVLSMLLLVTDQLPRWFLFFISL